MEANARAVIDQAVEATRNSPLPVLVQKYKSRGVELPEILENLASRANDNDPRARRMITSFGQCFNNSKKLSKICKKAGMRSCVAQNILLPNDGYFDNGFRNHSYSIIQPNPNEDLYVATSPANVGICHKASGKDLSEQIFVAETITDLVLQLNENLGKVDFINPEEITQNLNSPPYVLPRHIIVDLYGCRVVRDIDM